MSWVLEWSRRQKLIKTASGVLIVAVLGARSAAEEFAITATGGAQQATYAGPDVAFAAQQWQVLSDHGAGATVEFAAAPFTHTSDGNYQRNVELTVDLTADPSGVWGALGQVGTDVSDHETQPAADAIVQTASTAAGDADFEVTVTMLLGDAASLAAGDYTTTITGTLSAN